MYNDVGRVVLGVVRSGTVIGELKTKGGGGGGGRAFWGGGGVGGESTFGRIVVDN